VSRSPRGSASFQLEAKIVELAGEHLLRALLRAEYARGCDEAFEEVESLLGMGTDPVIQKRAQGGAIVGGPSIHWSNGPPIVNTTARTRPSVPFDGVRVEAHPACDPAHGACATAGVA
jgi:hypothetical protein